MKKNQIKPIFIILVSALITITAFLFFRKNYALEKKVSPISPADFVESKRHALDLLGGLVNSGFRVRDEVWEVSLKPRKMELLQLTLFAGNQYWFAVAASAPAERLKLGLYDNEGSPIALDLWKDDRNLPGARIAGGLIVTHSGNYYIGIELIEEGNKEPVPASLVYAYQ